MRRTRLSVAARSRSVASRACVDRPSIPPTTRAPISRAFPPFLPPLFPNPRAQSRASLLRSLLHYFSRACAVSLAPRLSRFLLGSLQRLASRNVPCCHEATTHTPADTHDLTPHLLPAEEGWLCRQFRALRIQFVGRPKVFVEYGLLRVVIRPALGPIVGSRVARFTPKSSALCSPYA